MPSASSGSGSLFVSGIPLGDLEEWECDEDNYNDSYSSKIPPVSSSLGNVSSSNIVLPFSSNATSSNPFGSLST